MYTDTSRRELLERLEGDLKETEGSQYVLAKREDLENVIKLNRTLTIEHDITNEDYNQLKMILQMYRMKEICTVEELEEFIKQQNVVEDIKSIQDLDEFQI